MMKSSRSSVSFFFLIEYFYGSKSIFFGYTCLTMGHIRIICEFINQLVKIVSSIVIAILKRFDIQGPSSQICINLVFSAWKHIKEDAKFVKFSSTFTLIQ